MTVDEKRKLVDSYDKWWHTIDFGDGVVSSVAPMGEGKIQKVPNNEEIKYWKLDKPEYFKGKTVLDIGAWDGYHSFYAEKCGASSVTAIDLVTWSDESWASKRGFDIAKEVLQSNVRDIKMDIMDATPENLGKFDFIIFAGVLYHLKNPFKAIEIIKSLLNDGGRLFLETQLSRLASEKELKEPPIMEFHPKDSLNNDSTNFWSPNLPCLVMMLGEADDFIVDDLFYINPYKNRGCIHGHMKG
tara:strand:- start:2419 stop:3147 length:729 start_codon:yes stop_codon:yes gene_type:complete